MKNKFIKIILLVYISFSINFGSKVLAEDFIFNVSELEISEQWRNKILDCTFREWLLYCHS